MGCCTFKMVGSGKKRIAYIFPGQGSQYIGMGKELFDKYPFVRDIYQKADSILGFNISKLCFEGPMELLTRTENTQPAILLSSVAASLVLKEEGVTPSFVAGHSLGEYSALVEAKGISFEEALKVVQKRGKFMQSAVPEGIGAMAAIIGLPRREIESICYGLRDKGRVSPANYNSGEQTVIAGEKEAVSLALDASSQRGAKRTVMLQVSAPFHCSMMKPAQEKLSDVLDEIRFSELAVPLITNVDALPITSGEAARDAVKRQVTAPVLWEDSMVYLSKKCKVDCIIEVGPSRVLSGLMRRIDKAVPTFSAGDIKGLKKTIEWLKK